MKSVFEGNSYIVVVRDDSLEDRYRTGRMAFGHRAEVIGSADELATFLLDVMPKKKLQLVNVYGNVHPANAQPVINSATTRAMRGEKVDFEHLLD